MVFLSKFSISIDQVLLNSAALVSAVSLALQAAGSAQQGTVLHAHHGCHAVNAFVPWHHAKQSDLCDRECSDWDCGGSTQDDDIPGIVRFRTYEVLKEEVNNPKLRWAYLPYSMHMAGPREAIQHMIIRRNYGERHTL